MRVCIVFITVLACFLPNGDANQPTFVHTKYGDIMGYQSDLARAFYGIPFAKPPVNELR